MTEEKIILEIDDDGNLDITTLGIKGPKCVEEVLKILEDLAAITELDKTDEFYQEVNQITKKNVEKRQEVLK